MKHFFKHPLLIIIVPLAATVFFALQLRGIKVDNDNRIFFPRSHASYQRLLKTEDTFGSTVVTGVVLKTPDRQFISDDNIRLVRKMTSELESLANIDEVQSLTNIDYLSGENSTLTAADLVGEDYSGTPDDLTLIRQKLANWKDMYDRIVLSDDMHSTLMMITFINGLDAETKQATLRSVRSVIEKNISGSDIKTTYVGDPVLSESSSLLMNKDLTVLIPLVIIVVLVCLFLAFKTADGTILPIITVLMGTVCALGMMSMAGITFTIVSTLIPVALIAVGSAYGIHVLNHYYIALDSWQEHNPGIPLTKEIHTEIILSGLRTVFLPVFLAGITTVAGFISLVTSPLTPLKSFAVFSSVGVALSLLFSVTFIPALLMLKPAASIKYRKNTVSTPAATAAGKADMSETLYAVYRFFSGTKPRLILSGLIITVFSVFGVRKLKIDTALINYFPADGQVRKDVDSVDKDFAGTNTLYFIVSGPEKGSMTDPAVLEPLDRLQQRLQAEYPDIGKVVSFTTFVKRMNQVMHIPQPAQSTSAEQQPQTGTAVDFADDFSFGDSTDAKPSTNTSSVSSNTGSAAAQSAAAAQNQLYTRRLAETVTVQQGLDMLRSAYTNAGGAHASLQEITDELEKELNYNGKAYYEIPSDPAKYGFTDKEQLKNLISQYLLLYSGSLSKFSDSSLEPSSVRVAVQMRKRSSVLTQQIIGETKAYAAAYFPKGYTIEATGTAELEYTMTNMIVSGQLTSMIFSLLCVFIILAFSFKSVWAGIIGCIPLILTILINYMVMGFAGINLDMFTSLIASLAVGIGIDYTIHFMTDYKENRSICTTVEETTRMTLKNSGKGIVTNAVSVGAGFIVLCLSNFVVLKYIGLLIAAVMFTSSVLAMTVIPAILNMTDPAFMKKKQA